MSPSLRDKLYLVPSHWVREEGLIDVPPPLRGDMGAYPVPPQIKREGLIVAPLSNLPQLRGDIGVHPMLLPIISEES